MDQKYGKEAAERYANTPAYREYEEKTQNYSKQQWKEATDGLMQLFCDFAVFLSQGLPATSPEALALAAKLEEHITSHFYTCDKTMLNSLGKLYVEDSRFRENIDRVREGTADYAAAAIAAYCSAD